MEEWKDAPLVDPLAARHALGKLKAFMGLKASEEAVTVGRYALSTLVGSGSFGKVYRAHDPELDRDVAIKIFHPKILDSARKRARARKEARALSLMEHPNVVQMFDAGVSEDRSGARLYLVMEYVEGEPLDAWIERTSPSLDAILDAFTKAGEGLQAAHDAGVLHMDFKPGNVMRAENGRVVVLDFGLARLIDPPPLLSVSASGYALDLSGSTIAGTPAFMPPEQFETRDVGVTADVYAFAASLLYVLLDDPERPTTLARLLAQKREPVEIPPGRVPGRIAKVLRRALAPRPADRYPSVGAMLRALAQARRSRTPRIAAGVAAGLGVTLALGLVVRSRQRAASECAAASTRLSDAVAEHDGLDAALGRSTADADAARERLERYAQGWDGEYREHCDANEPPAVAACLELSARVFEARLDAIVDTDASPGPLSVVTTGLPEDCADVDDALTPAVTTEATELSSWAFGRSTADDPQQQIERARSLGHGPTLLEVLLESARIFSARGETARARDAIARAHQAALDAHLERGALRAAAMYLGTPPQSMSKTELRRWAVATASACAQTEGVDRWCALAEVNRALAHAHFGELAEGRAAVEAARAQARESPPDDPLHAQLARAEGILAATAGDHEGALVHLRRSHAAAPPGRLREEVALALAASHVALGQQDEAAAVLQAELASTSLDRARTRLERALTEIGARGDAGDSL